MWSSTRISHLNGCSYWTVLHKIGRLYWNCIYQLCGSNFEFTSLILHRNQCRCNKSTLAVVRLADMRNITRDHRKIPSNYYSLQLKPCSQNKSLVWHPLCTGSCQSQKHACYVNLLILISAGWTPVLGTFRSTLSLTYAKLSFILHGCQSSSPPTTHTYNNRGGTTKGLTFVNSGHWLLFG